MTREHANEHAPVADNSIYAIPNAASDASADAITAVTEFAQTGKGKAKDMPRLLHRISNHDKNNSEVQLLLPKIAKRMDGDLFLSCAAGFNYPSYFTIDAALEDASPAASAAALRAYLKSRSITELLDLDIDPGVLAKVQKVLPKALAQELPVLAEVPVEMQRKPNIMRWFIDSTPPAVAAVILVDNASDELAATLDAIDRWAWLDALKIGGGVWRAGNMRLLRATKNKHAQDRLDAILKNAPADPDQDTTDYQKGAGAELAGAVGGKVTTDSLLDLTARAGAIDHRPEREMKEKISGKPAGDVLQFVIAARIALAEALGLLLGAPDVATAHVLALFTTHYDFDERLSALRDDRLRAKIRKVTGRSVPPTAFFDQSILQLIHPGLVKDEALVQWTLESNDPRSYLFIAAGTPAGEKTGFAAVKRVKGLDWVYQLPVDADNGQLRRLAMLLQDKPKQHVELLLGDSKIEFDAERFTAQKPDATIYGAGDRARFDVATMIDGTPEEDILSRIGDLEPDERAAVIADPHALSSTLVRLTADNAARAVYLLEPTVSQLLGTKIGFSPRILGYLRTRPPSEVIAAASSPAMIRRAQEVFGQSPFLIFPILLDPASLARALDANPALLAWILTSAEPNQALSALSREPVRSRAAAAFEEDTNLFDRFPKYRHLLPEGKTGADAIGKAIKDPDAASAAKDFQQNKTHPTAEVDASGKATHDAAKSAHLWDALLALDDKADANAALALVRAYPKDQLALLSGAHSSAVRKLRALVYTAPQVALPDVTGAQLLSSPDGLGWLLGFEAPFVVLHLVAGSMPALRQLAALIDANRDDINGWIDGLPVGANLQPVERAVLDDLRPYIGNVAVLQRLFAVRFGVPMSAGFDTKRTRELWAVLRRLPPSQVNQGAVAQFRQEDHAGAPGYWGDPDVVMSSDEKDFKFPDTGYDNSPLLTKAEIMGYYALDESTFTAATAKDTGWILEESGKFRVKPVSSEKFRSTALHEIGHSIDTLLGERTELVYTIAGFRTYGLDQVEQWAHDMNALDGLPDKHKEKVLEAWHHALRSGTPVKGLVDPGHPAVDAKLAHVPLIAAGIGGSVLNYKEKRQINNRVGLTGNNQGTISSVPKTTADIAPSEYSLYAPQEFFAECYVEYYRDFDGTNATKTTKGGRLPPQIRAWFDQNVDKIELNPQRYAKPDAGGGAPPPTATAAKSGAKQGGAKPT